MDSRSVFRNALFCSQKNKKHDLIRLSLLKTEKKRKEDRVQGSKWNENI